VGGGRKPQGKKVMGTSVAEAPSDAARLHEFFETVVKRINSLPLRSCPQQLRSESTDVSGHQDEIQTSPELLPQAEFELPPPSSPAEGSSLPKYAEEQLALPR
jgi:hypothetical protein